MSIGVLVDLTRCMGCRSCQVACKAWNDNPGEETVCWGTYENPPQLSPNTWTRVKFTETYDNYGDLKWVMHKFQCLHCLTPACASVCPVQVHQKTETGAVIYEEGKCIACRSCTAACPFSVPKIDWEDGLPEITRCRFCFDRVSNDEQPACAKSCATGALTFGERDELLSEAKTRIKDWPGKYVNHIYGEKEVGGTSWLYLSPIPFKALGFPTLSEEPVDVGMLPRPNLYPPIDVELEPILATNVGVTSGVIGFIAGAAAAIALRQLRKEQKEEEPEE